MLILIVMGCVMLLAETFVHGTKRAGIAWLGVAGCVAALAPWSRSGATPLIPRRTSRAC